MQLTVDVEFIGQKQESFLQFSDKTHTTIKRNWLSISVATDDGDVLTGRHFLPDGDVAEAAPLAKRGDRVRVTLQSFQQIKGATVATLGAVCPIEKAKK